ncbi:MAG: SDR family oxidoreductase [Nitrososphaerota archaeon]|nr:SDR family oxidoreductase [Nitrososphaerota archaeon]MDG6939090.1 SDR family oxidoreductase [Nitrososphaerota archaeon]
MYPGLRGRLAVVTGSGRGIGRAVAVGLAREGAMVVVNYRKHADEAAQTEKAITEAGGRCSVVQADVSTDEGAAALMDRASEHGMVEVLVNCAGLGIASPAVSVTSDMWTKQMDANLRSAFLCSSRFLAQLASRWGRVVNLSSVAGLHGAPLLSVYSATKAGLIGLTKSLAAEAPAGVTVNAVAPGVVKTKMGDSLLALLGTDERAWAKEHTVTGRLVAAEEVAELVAFLCSDHGASITGQVFVIDGGQAALQARRFFMQ